MSKKWKIALWVTIAVTIIGLLLLAKHLHNKLEAERAAKEQVMVEMKHLKDGSVRAEAKYVTKGELKALAKDSGVDLKPIESDIKKLGAEVKGLSRVVAKSQGFSGSNIASTSTEPRPKEDKPIPTLKVECPDGGEVECPNQDPYGYLSKKQILKLEEPFGKKKVPLGQVDFSAWKEKPWGLVLHPRDYSVVTVLSTTKNGRHFVHNKFTIDVDGKKETIDIDRSELVEIYPKSSFHFSPRLYLGVDAGAVLTPPVRGEIVPNLQISLFSYGRTKIAPDWTFLGLGLGYGTQKSTLDAILSPVNYNLGNFLPLVDNLHTGPSVTLDTKGGVGLLWGLRVGL